MQRRPDGIASTIVFLTAALVLLRHGVGQCEPQWLPGTALTGAGDDVKACVAWDPDGAGPATPLLVIGGRFATAGGTVSRGIAAWDPATNAWSGFGTGVAHSVPGIAAEVNAIATAPNGDLVIAGNFTSAGGVAANRIARWTGTGWIGLGNAPFSDPLLNVAVRLNGDVFTGESFRGGLWHWNGATWAFVSPYFDTAQALLRLANDDIVVSGTVNNFGSTVVRRWDGISWTPMGSVGTAVKLAELSDGTIVAGGTSSLAAYGASRWNGSSWTQLGAGLHHPGPVYGDVTDLAPLPNGELLAVGNFSRSGSTVLGNIARWNGTAWQPYAADLPNYPLAAAILPGGRLVVGGTFLAIGSTNVHRIAQWSGTGWQALGAGTNGEVRAAATLSDGSQVVGGTFTQIGGVPANRIARWDGSSWSPLGTGTGGAVSALLALPNGELIAGGYFGAMGGVTVNRIARWNGAAWQPLGQGMNDGVVALARLPNGDVIAGGYFTTAGGIAANRIARWDGTNWSPLGAGLGGNLPFASARCLHVLADGSVVVGGLFTSAGALAANRIARWDGANWSTFGNGMSSGVVLALTTDRSGQLIAGGDYFTNPVLGEWDGTSWNVLGAPNGDVFALTTLPNGDLVVGGRFTQMSGTPVQHLARYDGNSWNAMQNGTDAPVLHLHFSSTALVASGRFARAGDQASAGNAMWSATCPATATAYGTTCVGPAGPLVAAAETLPWTGATFRSRASGFAPTAVGAVGIGLASQSTSLSTVHPTGQPGCLLSTSLDAVSIVLPNGGVCSQSLSIPDAPGLVGLQLHVQFLQLDLPPAGAPTSSSSNGIELSIGAF